VLRDSICAALVVDAWRHFDGRRYRLHAWVLMPNHVHVVLTVFVGSPLSALMQAQKSFTAHRIRRNLGGAGSVWHPDYWDRFIRDDAHFVAAVEYVEDNPVRAGLVARREDWPWSSATALRCGRDARGPSR
jgi:REP element-mobilizing transposase RayT